MSVKLSKILKIVIKGEDHWFYTTLVLLNAFIIGAESFLSRTSSLREFFQQVIFVFFCIFVAEIAIKFFFLRTAFFKDHRNIYIAFVLAVAAVTQFYFFTLLLVFVSLRSFRSFKFIPKTRHLIDTLFHTIPGVINIVIFIFMAYVTFSILGTHLFGAQVPQLWGNFLQSFISLQQIMLGDDWGNNLRATMQFHPHVWIFNLCFLFIVTMILLNLFIGVVMDAMQTAAENDTTKSNQDSDPGVASIKKEVALLRKDIKDLRSVIVKKKKT